MGIFWKIMLVFASKIKHFTGVKKTRRIKIDPFPLYDKRDARFRYLLKI